MNEKTLDFEKTYFVVDSLVSAFMTSILAGGNKINLIIEKKTELDTDEFINNVKNFINMCIDVRSIVIQELPHRFYINSWDLGKILHIKKETKKIYSDFDDDVVFVGSSTSTFMRGLTNNKENIYFLYHGMTDCIRMEQEDIARKRLINKIKRLIIGNIIGLPYSTWCNFWPVHAYSMCKLENDVATWINLYDFQSDKIEIALNGLAKYKDDRTNVLFFPIDSGHTSDGVNSDTRAFNDVNIKFLSKHVNYNKERVFIKYHPWLYRTNIKLKSDFIEILKEQGYEAYDIGEIIPVEIGGTMIPTEVLCRFFKFDKLIAQDTSTIWYLGEDSSVKKILDISFADQDTKELLRDCYTRMKCKCKSETVKIFDD